VWQAARSGSENRLAVQATPEGKNHQWFCEHICTAGFPWKNTFRMLCSKLPDAKIRKYVSFYLKFRESSGLQQ
jgi:hypothetical protein